jgi:RNA recognition motif-containing protein
VYVAGIPRRVNEEDLKRVFEKYGPIADIKVIKDPLTNNSKGFAYILFEKVEDATNAIRGLDNQRVFNDWSLRVERAKRAVAYQVE